MDTLQSNAEPTISPPYTWSKRTQLGFGVVASIPLVLLTASLGLLALSVFGVGAPVSGNAVPIAFYTHICAQFITLLVFGHLMIQNDGLGGTAKLIWGLGFLFLAPIATLIYWAIHVWRADQRESPEVLRRKVHVYDYDYEHSSAGLERHEDGSIVHHLDPAR